MEKAKDFAVSVLRFDQSSNKKIFSGKYYSFLFVLSGSCCFQEADALHRCGHETLILMKPDTCIELFGIRAGIPLELIRIQYDKSLLKRLSSEQTRFDKDILLVPYTCTSVACDSTLLMLCKNLARKLLLSEQESQEYAQAVFADSLLSLLLILMLRSCIRAEVHQKSSDRRQFQLDNIFAYISAHITEDITLEHLADAFFTSKYHISREFKKHTGTTVHKYIVRCKLELCCKYIAQGYPITEVYKLCGFGGYNHLFRAFKQEFGMTPMEYYRSISQ